MGMAAPVYYTAEMVRAMPDDGNRYEVVYGELLVTPAPRPWHQVLVQRLSLATSGPSRSGRRRTISRPSSVSGCNGGRQRQLNALPSSLKTCFVRSSNPDPLP
jgi:hypothetical protein